VIGCALMLRDASQHCEAVEALAHAARCDAPQHEGREGPCILARRSAQQNTWLVRAKNQPVGVENGREGVLPVSGLFFTGSCATPARAADTEIESRQIISARPCASVGTRCGRVRKQLRVEKRASILLINRNLQETAQRERVNCQRPGHRAANSVCSLSPFGERVVRGLQNYRETLTPHPHLSQPKSDLSNFGRLKVPNSGKPEFGGRGCRPSSPQPSSLPGSSRQSIVFAKRFSKNDGPAGQARG